MTLFLKTAKGYSTMNNSKILVIGSNGQLGTDMLHIASENTQKFTGIDFPQIDITDRESVHSVFSSVKPDFIINCAAFTAVDDCETKMSIAQKVNADGPGILAQEADRMNSVLIHISTDYVFDGNSVKPYIESDKTSPLTVYGKTKLDGERQIAQYTDRYQIYRIAWLYGLYGNNFVKTIKNAALKKQGTAEGLKVVNDQSGTPTWTVDVCNQIFSTMHKDLFGIFHCTSEGSCTWYDFARTIVDSYNIDTVVNPCTTEEFPRPAPRPKFSVLENAALKAVDSNLMPFWKDSFKAFLEAEKNI